MNAENLRNIMPELYKHFLVFNPNKEWVWYPDRDALVQFIREYCDELVIDPKRYL